MQYKGYIFTITQSCVMLFYKQENLQFDTEPDMMEFVDKEERNN